MPEVFWVAICWKAFRMPTTVPNRPMNGAVEPMVARTAEAPLQLGVNDGFRPLQRAARALDGLLGGGATGSAELLQAGGDDFGQMGLLVAVGDLDRLFQLAVLQGAGNLGRKLARLLAGSREVQVTVDHDGQRPDRLDEKKNGHAAGQPSHVIPQPHGAEADRLLTSWKKGPGC